MYLLDASNPYAPPVISFDLVGFVLAALVFPGDSGEWTPGIEELTI
jgi:hypothetical protein